MTDIPWKDPLMLPTDNPDWTTRDWTEAVRARYRKAAEETAEAKAFDDFAQEIVAEMQVRGCRVTGDLFTGEDVK